MTRLRGNTWWRIWWKWTDSCLLLSIFLLSTNRWGITPCCTSWRKSLESSRLRRGAHSYYALKFIDQLRSPWNQSLMRSLCKGKSLTKPKAPVRQTKTLRSSLTLIKQTLRIHFWGCQAILQKAKKRPNSQGHKRWRTHLLGHKPSILSATSRKKTWALTVQQIARQIVILSTAVMLGLRVTTRQILLSPHLILLTNSKD